MSELDYHYFAKKLQLVLRDVQQYTAEELALELYRLASTANPTIQSARINELGVQLSASQAREKELREKLEAAEALNSLQAQSIGMLSKELEAAEARIKASQGQEPFKFCDTATGRVHDYAYDCEGNAKALYLEPVIPPELAELQRENAELTRKLAEQQALLRRQYECVPDKLLAESKKEELRKLLEEIKKP